MSSNSEFTKVFGENVKGRLNIGVLKNNRVSPRDTFLIEGLREAAKDNDVNIIVYCGGMISSPEDIDMEAAQIFDFVDKNRLDGLIIWTGNINWYSSMEFTEAFVKKYDFLPVVSLEIKIDGITSIIWDDYNGMRDALVHLIEVHKYKRIGFVMGDSPVSVYHRYEAYIQTLADYGIPIDPNLIIDHNKLYNYSSAFDYAIHLHRSINVDQAILSNYEESIKVVESLWKSDIEALVCFNDMNTRTISRLAKERNLPSLPMVGFDDDIESRAANPALTTVRPPIYEMGKRALEVILTKIKGLQTQETEILPCKLIIRQSCGCPCNSVMKEDILKKRLQQGNQLNIENINACEFEKIIKSIVDTVEHKRQKQKQRHFDIIAFSQKISSKNNIKDIVEIMASNLKHLGIISCYLSVFENGATSKERARILLAYNESGPIEILEDLPTFPSKLLVPDEVLPQNRHFQFILMPLHFRKRKIGFVLFEDTLEDMSEYEQLSEAISNAINGVILIDELKVKALQLEKSNIELQCAYSLLKENQQKLLISEKMALLGRLTTGIAHEMTTPLDEVCTALIEFSLLIDKYNEYIDKLEVLPQDHRKIAQEMEACLKLAVTNGEKSAGFIKGIKAQTTNINTSNCQLFNLADVIVDSLSILDFSLKKGNCRLITDLDNSIKFYGNPNSFVQMITNLVLNSIEACKPFGGEISIILKQNYDGFVRITVQDTGCGIPEEIKSRIFDPMFTTKPFGEGTGLGLSIVLDLVKNFNGRINVESKKGLTSFYVFLPIEKQL